MDFGIFHAYDIRGIYPTEINDEGAYQIARGYAQLFNPKVIAVGMDARLSSPALKKMVIKGLTDSGVDVVDIDRVTTDMIYFAVGHYGYSGGIIVSASHNPGEYNGMKLVKEKAAAISSETGLYDLRDLIKDGKLNKEMAATPGKCEEREILDDYTDYILSFVDADSIKKFRFVGNTNFGYANKSLQKVTERLGLDLIPLNFEPDGTFPKGPPDPMLPSNRTETEALIKEKKVDFAAAWDADADRVMFFDENGRFIHGAYTTALLAKILLEKFGSDNKIIYDPRVIWPVEKTVREMKGTPIMARSGHAFMKEKMRDEDALFAGELSAHYYFRDNYYADNGMIPFLLILEYLSRKNIAFSRMMDPIIEGHFMSGELNYTVKDIKKVMDTVKEEFKGDGREDYTDGYSLETADWRFNIRASNTQPLLRLNIEAPTEQSVHEMREKLERIIYS